MNGKRYECQSERTHTHKCMCESSRLWVFTFDRLAGERQIAISLLLLIMLCYEVHAHTHTHTHHIYMHVSINVLLLKIHRYCVAVNLIFIILNISLVSNFIFFVVIIVDNVKFVFFLFLGYSGRGFPLFKYTYLSRYRVFKVLRRVFSSFAPPIYS